MLSVAPWAKAEKVFERLPFRDIFSWNAVIAGYVEHELDDEVLSQFKKMQLEGFFPDAITFAYNLKSCGNLGAIQGQ